VHREIRVPTVITKLGAGDVEQAWEVVAHINLFGEVTVGRFSVQVRNAAAPPSTDSLKRTTTLSGVISAPFTAVTALMIAREKSHTGTGTLDNIIELNSENVAKAPREQDADAASMGTLVYQCTMSKQPGWKVELKRGQVELSRITAPPTRLTTIEKGDGYWNIQILIRRVGERETAGCRDVGCNRPTAATSLRISGVRHALGSHAT